MEISNKTKQEICQPQFGDNLSWFLSCSVSRQAVPMCPERIAVHLGSLSTPLRLIDTCIDTGFAPRFQSGNWYYSCYLTLSFIVLSRITSNSHAGILTGSLSEICVYGSGVPAGGGCWATRRRLHAGSTSPEQTFSAVSSYNPQNTLPQHAL